MKTLFVIPARGGSKGLPGKNVRPLNGKPLLIYSLEFAREFTSDENICVTTDSEEIAASARTANYEVPFKRPEHLSTDTAGTYEVLKHAIEFYNTLGKQYDALVLLQPTSPFRLRSHLTGALELFSDDVDMVVSVEESKANPYFNLFEENGDGYLSICKGSGKVTSRQLAPQVYAYNGSIYVINTRSLEKYNSFSEFTRIRKYLMDARYSIDIDSVYDWQRAESLAKELENSDMK